MKTYEVELQRTTYVTVTVEAENEDEAEALAFKRIKADVVDMDDSHWFVESVEQIFN
jgi:hypothetical protein